MHLVDKLRSSFHAIAARTRIIGTAGQKKKESSFAFVSFYICIYLFFIN